MFWKSLARLLVCAGLVIGKPAHSASFDVSDTNLLDHGNAHVAGTVANALAQCENTDGGIVNIGPGVFQVGSTLLLGRNCRLSGAGSGATILNMNGLSDLIRVRSGRSSVHAKWSIENVGLQLPSHSAASMIVTTPLQANNGIIRNVYMSGGGPASWGIRIDAALHIEISHAYYEGGGNGISWENSYNLRYNIGDAIIQDTEVVLRSQDSVGILLASPTNTNWSQSVNRVNNILLSRVEVRTPDGVVRSNTIGIKLRNTARITLINVDVEQMDIGILQQSGVDGGAVSVSNTFIQVFYMGCNRDHVLEGMPPVQQMVLGGYGSSPTPQQLPTSEILAEHAILGSNRVFTAVRPIEAYSDSSQPRVLTTIDSGKIFTNRGATGTVEFHLPPANMNNSLEYEFHLAIPGHRIRVLPAAGDLIRPGQIATNRYYESGHNYGQVLKIRNIDATIWSIESQQGTWTTIAR